MAAPPLPALLTAALLPSGSGEGAARSTGGAGRAASRSGGSSPPDPARAAAARRRLGEQRGRWLKGRRGNPTLYSGAGAPSLPCPPSSAGAGAAAGRRPAGPRLLADLDRKDGHAPMLKKGELLVPMSLDRSLRELRQCTAPIGGWIRLCTSSRGKTRGEHLLPQIFGEVSESSEHGTELVY